MFKSTFQLTICILYGIAASISYYFDSKMMIAWLCLFMVKLSFYIIDEINLKTK